MGRKNLPPVIVSVLPPHPMLEFPSLHPTPQDSQIFLLLGPCLHLCLTPRPVCTRDGPEKENEVKMGNDMFKRKKYRYKLITRGMRGMGGVLPELCCSLSTGPHHCFTLQLLLFHIPPISLSFASLVDINTL